MTLKRPTGGKRGLKIAGLSLDVAGSYLGYFVQRPFVDDKDAHLANAHARAGRRIRANMQELRGPMMKLGQMLSLQGGVLPDDLIAELSTLQMQAPGMHPSLVRAQFRASMRQNPESLFRKFDDEPFAAASLGQVHRAVTPDGDRVAVKIQYPGIRDAIATDFKLLRAAALPARASGHMPGSALTELERQILAETDYVREADNTESFRANLQPLGFVDVPRVYRKLSSERVLTMEMIDGEQIESLLAHRPSQAQRDIIGAQLVELLFFQILRIGAFHADPNWGNYLFRPDSSIGLIDFGCVKHLDPRFVDHLREVYLYPGPRDSAEFRRLIAKRYELFDLKASPATIEAFSTLSDGFYRRVYPPEPERDGDAIDFRDPELIRQYVRQCNAVTKSKGILPEYVLFARAEMGLYNTLHKLKARVPMSAIVRRHLHPRTQRA
ncbi:MAG TPA: AarF/ABC1/UbiB kinase family protein [Gemmatimonadaceae bacterium]|jgi:predicted unusual protein kinase regulating ubiquinone biosynthesis (AarF/ABC1/UbiB family)|nr:AarF/ABC1/UbiB kinase family protein [Gemmatimonadaceae bacterium]